jgi:hypothetical protein
MPARPAAACLPILILSAAALRADPQLVVKRPMDLACLMAVRNRLAAAIAHREMPELSGALGGQADSAGVCLVAAGRAKGQLAATQPRLLLCFANTNHQPPLP